MSSPIFFAPFERALRTPFLYGAQKVSARRGFLLRKGREAPVFSEASPLPGHSSDSLEDVAHALARFSRDAALPPSLRFALEALEFQERPGPFPVESNAVIPLVPETEARSRVRDAVEAGYRVVKLKVSAGSWEGSLRLVEEFAQIRFRLDANQGLSTASLGQLLDHAEKKGLSGRIDYLEEPFEGFFSGDFFRGARIAFAADESAPSLPAAQKLLEAANAPSVFVLKPTAMGGLSELEAAIQRLEGAGKRCVITSALETEPGRRSLIAFLSRRKNDVAGLSTGGLFQENFLPDRARWEQVPPISAAELEALARLPWKELA